MSAPDAERERLIAALQALVKAVDFAADNLLDAGDSDGARELEAASIPILDEDGPLFALLRAPAGETRDAEPDARRIVERHRRHVELSPGVGADAQRYALAALDDVLADLPVATGGPALADVGDAEPPYAIEDEDLKSAHHTGFISGYIRAMSLTTDDWHQAQWADEARAILGWTEPYRHPESGPSEQPGRSNGTRIEGWMQPAFDHDAIGFYTDAWFKATGQNPYSELNDPPLERRAIVLHDASQPGEQR